jgi:dsRNA-specific ribonuclease
LEYIPGILIIYIPAALIKSRTTYIAFADVRRGHTTLAVFTLSKLKIAGKSYPVRMKMTDQPLEIHRGIRGLEFKALILSLLERGNLKPKYVDFLTSPEAMEKYGQSFTSASADSKVNYEMYEQLGDLSVNKFVVWYSHKRFPQLNCPLGVKVAARLRINYGSRDSLSRIGEELGFWPFISASEEDRYHKKKDLIEDCMESFVGCTEYMLDEEFIPGIGYPIVYNILKSIFDGIDISLAYDDLYDPKTRLKELFDSRKDLGTWRMVATRGDDKITKVVVLVQNQQRGGNIVIGEGFAARKGDAEQKAATQALAIYKSRGIFKPVSAEYLQFCKK